MLNEKKEDKVEENKSARNRYNKEVDSEFSLTNDFMKTPEETKPQDKLDTKLNKEEKLPERYVFDDELLKTRDDIHPEAGEKTPENEEKVEKELLHRVRHIYEIHISKLSQGKNLEAIRKGHLFLRYFFSWDEQVVESDKLTLKNENSYDYSVNLTSQHNFSLSSEENLSQHLPDAHNGLSFNICEKAGYEEKILGTAILPFEDFVELKEDAEESSEQRSTFKRTLIIFPNKNDHQKAALLGKLSVQVSYSRENLVATKEDFETIFEKQITVERMFPKNTSFNIMVSEANDLQKALTYLRRKNPAFASSNNLNTFVRVNVFHRDSRLMQKMPLLETDIVQNSLNPKFKFKHSSPLSLDADVIEYIRGYDAYIELRFIPENQLLSLHGEDSKSSSYLY
jgi:hypothetical protein